MPFDVFYSIQFLQIQNLMKKKVEEKKEIVAIFQPGLYWQYKKCTSQEIDKVDAFINNFTNELKALISLQKPLEENYTILADKMGTNIHPSLAFTPKQQSQYPSLKNNDYGQKYAIFLNHKIDLITWKLFGFLISIYKINSIKISNNNLENQIDDIKKVIQKEDQITSLYFQWNPILEYAKRNELFLACVRPSIVHLILRECKIGNQIARQVIKKIKENPDSKLKSLDLYGNALQSDIADELSIFIEQNKTLQFLGLSKNNLNTDPFLARFFNSFGEIALSQQEYEQHKLKEKVRDEILEKNKKRKKGTPEQPVPFVLQIKQNLNGKFYIKNTVLKVLNLASNSITDNSAIIVRNFVENNGKKIQLFIQGNKFSKKVKQTLKFFENVIL